MPKSTLQLPWFLTLLLAIISPRPASQAAETEAPEADVVLRVSRSSFRKALTFPLHDEDTVSRPLFRSWLSGHSQTNAVLAFDLDTRPDSAALLVEVRGEVTSQTVATEGPVRVLGHGRVPFAVRKRVPFDGLQFHDAPAVMCACSESIVDGIETPPRLRGLALRAVARPAIRLRQPAADRIAVADVRAEILPILEKESAQVIADLNQALDPKTALVPYLPSARDWVYRVEATDTHFIAIVGPRGTRIAVLPPDDSGLRAPVELWVRDTPGTSKLRTALRLWALVGGLLGGAQTADKSDGVRGLKIVRAGNWLVLKVGEDMVKLAADEVEKRFGLNDAQSKSP